MRLIFERKAGHKLIVDGKEILSGETFTVAAKRAKELLAQFGATVREAPGDDAPAANKSKGNKPKGKPASATTATEQPAGEDPAAEAGRPATAPADIRPSSGSFATSGAVDPPADKEPA